MIKEITRLLLAAILLLPTTHVMAASGCKGMTQPTCGKQASCYWVKGYKRSDGAQVKAHCRARPTKKQSQSTLDSAAKSKTSSSSSKASKQSNTSNKAAKSNSSSKQKSSKSSKSSKKSNNTKASSKKQASKN